MNKLADSEGQVQPNNEGPVLSALGVEERGGSGPDCGNGRQRDSATSESAAVGDHQGEGGATIPPNDGATVQLPADGCTLAQYAEAMQLPEEFLREIGLTEFHYMSRPAVRVPYLDASGNEAAMRFRTAASERNCLKWRNGSKPSLYGLWRLNDARAKGHVVLVDSESAAQVLWYHDVPALALPDATAWKEEWADHLDGIATIYVVTSEANWSALCKWIASSRIRDRVHLVCRGTVESLHKQCGQKAEGFSEKWEAWVKAASSWCELARAEAARRSEEAHRCCERLAREPRILDRFPETLDQRGVVGETNAAKLIYLIITSRFLDRPLSAALKGESAAGKSYLTEQVLRFFPDSACYALTAMSERALAYSEEPLAHRILVLFEAAGLQGDFGSYLLRSLLSEGRLRYETVEKTNDGLKARVIEREGPTGLLVTTTAVRLHPENETRLFSIPVTDTPEQTHRVMMALAKDADRNADLTQWCALQDWLKGAEHRVVIPFARVLAKLARPVAVRMRRDFGQVLALIKTHAMLHQATRERDDKGRIVASLDDYAVIRGLVADLVAENVGAAVPDITRQTVEAVRELSTAGQIVVSVSHVAKRLNMDKSSASRRVKVAVEKGYLRRNHDDLTHSECLVLSEPLPEETEVLPTVEGLKSRLAEGGCTVAAKKEGITPPSPLPTASDQGVKP